MRWEVPDEGSDAMRALTYDDLKEMADSLIADAGHLPELNEDWSDRIVAKLSKKYGIRKPFPKWMARCAKDIMENSGLEVPCHSAVSKRDSGWFDYRDRLMSILRKHTGQ